jgi:hypothetical protein
LEGVIRDYCSTIKGGSEPQMEGVVCHTGQWDVPTTGEGKIASWST